MPAEQREAALLGPCARSKTLPSKAREAAKMTTHSADCRQRRQPSASQLHLLQCFVHRTSRSRRRPSNRTVSLRTQSESDRRRFQRIKCYVAVEIHVEGEQQPVWGNLANVSRGGCLVETASAVPAGKALEIGLWVASGKIWVKGVIISGVATRSAPSFGVRVKFSQAELPKKNTCGNF